MASTPRSGIAEEFMCSLDAKQPIYLCGGFGGMSAALSAALQKQAPESLTDNFHTETKLKRKAYDEYNATDAGTADPSDYKKLVERLADEGVDGLRNGLSIKENRRLFESQSVEEIVGLVREGLNLTLGKK